MDKTTNHLLLDYLHNSLPEADRSALETRLRNNGDLMAELSHLRNLQQQFQSGISAEINQSRPPSSMTFQAIAADLPSRGPRHGRSNRILSGLTAFAALAILLFSVIYSLPDRDNAPLEGSAATTTPLQTEALPFVGITPTLTPTLSAEGASIPTPTKRSSIPARPETETPEPQSFILPDGSGGSLYHYRITANSKLLQSSHDSAIFAPGIEKMDGHRSPLVVDQPCHPLF